MKKLDAFEEEILAAYEKGELKSNSPSKAKLAKFKAAASATFIKDRRINIRLSSPDIHRQRVAQIRFWSFGGKDFQPHLTLKRASRQATFQLTGTQRPPTFASRTFCIEASERAQCVADFGERSEYEAIHCARSLASRQKLHHFLNPTTLCVCTPNPSIPKRITSPRFKYSGAGFMPMPTPGGVPVVMTSPGISVMNWLT